MNLHDWIDELCDVLEIDLDVDETLILDLARDAAHQVTRPAAPITTFLLGYAAGRVPDHTIEHLEELAGRASALAMRWDKPAEEVAAEVEVPDEVPDDSGVDHTGEVYPDAPHDRS